MKIGWILSSSKNNAGSRIHGWNIHEYFLKNNLDSNIIYSSSKYGSGLEFSKEELQKIIDEKYNVILLVGFKDKEGVLDFIEFAKKNNIKIIYIKTDEIPESLVKESDFTIVVNEYVKNEFPKELQSKIRVISDGYEHEGINYKKHSSNKKITIIFVSNNVYSKFPQIEQLPEGIKLKIIGPPKERVEKFKPGKKIFTDTPYPYEYKVWNLDTIEKEILDSDVAVIPYPEKHLQDKYINRKSSNRLILFMSYGLPTIVSPISEYEKIIMDGKNGFIAKSKEDWENILIKLRDNPDLRERIGLVARQSVKGKCSLKVQAENYLKLIKESLIN